jgi:hypothetical protein
MKPARLDARHLGGVRREDQAMTQEQRVDHIGGKPPPGPQKPKVDKRAFRTAGGNPPSAPSGWVRSLSTYDRRERGENQVTRFG